MNPADYMRSPFFLNNKWVQVSNQSEEVIPPFSVVYVDFVATGNNNFGFAIKQPNLNSTSFDREYLVTGPYAIAAAIGAEGIATDLCSPGLVRYDSSGTPTKNQVWGPKHAQLSLSLHYYGFYCYGEPDPVITVADNNVAVFKQIGLHSICGKVDDTDVALGDPATVSVWTSDRSSDTGMNVAAYNFAVDLEDVAGKRCLVLAPGTYGELVMVECG